MKLFIEKKNGKRYCQKARKWFVSNISYFCSTMAEVNQNKLFDALGLESKNDGVFNAGAALLTYSNCRGLRHQEVVDFYYPDTYRDLLYLAVEEAHKSEEPHIHIYMERQDKHYIRGQIKSRFDIWKGEEDQRRKYHPNVAKANKNDRIRIIKYLLMDQDLKSYKTPEQKFLTNMPEAWIRQAIMELQEGVRECKAVESAWLVALRMASEGNYEGALDVVRRNYPRDYTINKTAIEKSFKSMYRRVQPIKPYDSFVVPDGVKYWMKKMKNYRSLYIWGPGDSGKTQMARAILKQLIDEMYPGQEKTFAECHGSLDYLSIYNPAMEHGVLVDDVKIKDKYEAEQVLQVLSVKDASIIKCRYSDGRIPAGHFKIITSNCSFEEWLPKIDNQMQLDACYNRVVIVEVEKGKKLYKDETGKQVEHTGVKKIIFKPGDVINISDDEEGEKKDDDEDSVPTLIVENSQPLILPNDDDDFWQPVVPETINEEPLVLQSVFAIDSEDEAPTLKRKQSNSPEEKQDKQGWFQRKWKYSKEKLKLKKKF